MSDGPYGALAGADIDGMKLVAELVAEYRRIQGELEAAADARDTAMIAAVAGGVPAAEVARVAGVSRQRVGQMTKRAGVSAPRVHAQKKGRGSVRVNDPTTVPTIPDTPDGLLSGVASLRNRGRYGKPTGFTEGTDPLLLVLEWARSRGKGRVFLTGPAPWANYLGTQHEAVTAWAGQDVAGWYAGDHYLSDPMLPVLRYVHAESGHRVVVMRAAMWWGETDADVATCLAAWAGLERLVESVPAFAGGGLADTPATAGRALWLRTIPEGKSYPVLAPEIRQLIAATSGQGRIGIMPAPPHPLGFDRPPVGEDFTYLDGRLMYAALTWGMPIGEPTVWGPGMTWPTDLERLLRGRGRWRITARVPEGWAHIGLLPCKADGDTWQYPNQPGQVFTTWADGSEVWLAMSHGWAVEVHEGLTWTEGKPLNTWRDALVKLWGEANAAAAGGRVAPALAARAVRSMLIYALGAFAARGHTITRRAPIGSAEVPDGVAPRIVGDELVWQEEAPVAGWSERTAHPEWSATVWARARVRLAEAALRLPYDAVVAMSTDALYVAGGPPEWEDSGKPGEFRVKGHRPGPFTWPATYAELFKLRDESESAR